MEIAKNSTNLTKKNLAGFQNMEMLRKSWLVAICAVLLIIVSFSIENGHVVLRSIPFLVIGCAVYPFYILLLKILFARQNKNFHPTRLEYIFTDQKLYVIGKSDVAEEKTELLYTSLTEVKSTKNFIYLYISKASALVVDKKGFTSGSAEKVLNLLDLRFKEAKSK